MLEFNQINQSIHTHKHAYMNTYIHMTGPDCAVMCNLINIYTRTYIHTSLIPPWEDQCEWHRMTRMTRSDCAVMCNLINIHTHINTYIHTYIHTYMSRLIRGFRNKYQVSLIPPWEDQCEWHRMTRMTGPDSAVMCNLINMHTYISTRVA